MIENLRNHLISRPGHDTSNLDDVLLHFKTVSLKRNEQLLRQGDGCRWVYFVSSGYLQVYGIDDAGNKTTRDIVAENNWCSELISFGSGQPSTENIRSVEPTKLCAIDKASFQTLITAVPQFDKVYKQKLETSYTNSVYRLNSFVLLSASDRVKWLMQYRPELIAFYLGISGETFSRLKAKL
jgi:CRP-like cAMP-binding protein